MSRKCQQVGIPLDDIFIISWLILTNVMSLNCYQEYSLTKSIFTIENACFFCLWSSHGHVTYFHSYTSDQLHDFIKYNPEPYGHQTTLHNEPCWYLFRWTLDVCWYNGDHTEAKHIAS